MRSQKKVQVIFYLIAILATFFSSVPMVASASGFLVSSTPSSEQHLTDPPTEISLLFSVGTLPASFKGNVVRVTNSAGVPVDVGDAKSSGMTLSIGLNKEIQPDRYQVAYRYVCDDGHVLVGAYSFVFAKVETVAASTPPSQPRVKVQESKGKATSSPSKMVEAPTPLASPSERGSVSTGPQSQASGADSQTSSPVAIRSEPTGSKFSPLWVLLGLACAIGLCATWIAVRRLVRRNWRVLGALQKEVSLGIPVGE